MVTYYDRLNAVFKFFEKEPLTPAAQLLVLHLLQLNNRLGNTGSVQVSDNQLRSATGLSKQSITDAKRRLKNVGLIDFHSSRGSTTIYTLIIGNQQGHPTGQKVGQKVGHSPRSNSSSSLSQKKKEEGEARVREWTELDEGLRRDLGAVVKRHGEAKVLVVVLKGGEKS